MTPPTDGYVPFARTDGGLSRFPPNVETILVEQGVGCKWLIVRRNDVVLQFPLEPEACAHLAAKLLDGYRSVVGAAA